MCNGIIQNNESVENHIKDPAMLETPIADHLISHNDIPQETNKNRNDGVLMGDGKFFSSGYINTDRNDYYSSPLVNKNTDVNSFNKELKEYEDEPLPHSPPRFNRRTPDLDKISNFFRNNRTPKQKKLLAQFESSVNEDTPVSQRRDNSPLKPRSNKKLSDSNYMRNLSNEYVGSSLEVTEADMQDKIEISKDHKFTESQNGSTSMDKLRFLDHGTQSQEKFQTQEIQRTRNFQDAGIELPNINKNHDEHIGIHSDEVNPNTFLDNTANGDDHNDSVSRVNDTTDGDLSVQWIFRASKNNQVNSNKSTQIIPGAETQDEEFDYETQKTQQVPTQTNETQTNETQTQVVASLYAQETSVNPENNDFESPTQIVRSPEHNFDENAPDILDSNKFSTEGFSKSPDVSSLSNSKDVIEIESSPGSPKTKTHPIPKESFEEERDSQERVLLQISGKPESFPNFELENGRERNLSKDTAMVVSETELTQDLPEVEEQVSQDKKKEQEDSFKKSTLGSFEESQEITKNTWKRSKRNRPTIIQEEDGDGEQRNEETGTKSGLITPPKKKMQCENIYVGTANYFGTLEKNFRINEGEQTREKFDFGNRIEPEGWLKKIEDFPQEIKGMEKDFLSKRDIKFEDAVWCQYDLNYCFYPGRLLSYDEKVDGCWVIFETGQSLTKNDDIYYLDIRVGDTVNWQGRVHKVIALECRTQDPNVIRCIRGFDTVHLRKRNVSGKLAKKTALVPLSSISLDLNEWAKRPKVILEEGSHTSAKAFKFLRHPIRGRKNVNTNLSPRRARLDSGTMGRLTYKEDSDDDYNDSITSVDRNVITKLSSKLDSPGVKRKLFKSKDKGIFEDCLFILSGLNEEKYDLSEVITSLGGTIIETGFPDLFHFESLIKKQLQVEEYTLGLDWKTGANFRDFRFACLLTTKHLRSLKYLETLALGWPTLHWKFVEDCVSNGKLYMGNIHQYLLPSGESFRLQTPKEDQFGVIKSNNIFQFYSRLLQNALLKDQIGHNSKILSNYFILIFGHSELDQFIKFILACLGTKKTFLIPSKIGNPTEIQNLDNLTSFANDILLEQRDFNNKVIIYINGANGLSNEILDENKERIHGEFVYQGKSSPNIHVESKEWLIQTLINGHPGF